MKLWHTTLLAAALGLVPSGGSGANPRPPAFPPYAVCLPNSQICALVNSEFGRTTVIRTSRRESEILWSIPFAAEKAYLSPDARYLVFAHRIEQQITTWHGRDYPLIIFWNQQGMGARVDFADLFPVLIDPTTKRERFDHSAMEPSKLEPDGYNFYYWGNYLGFNREGQFEVAMLHDGVIKFDPATGKRVP